MIRNHFLPVIVSLLFFGSLMTANGQQKSLSFSTGPILTNDGINLQFNAAFSFSKNTVSVGPLFDPALTGSLTESYKGLTVGYERKLAGDDRLISFAGLNVLYYSFGKNTDRLFFPSVYNHHKEINACYGFEIKPLSHFKLWIGSKLGIGFYNELYSMTGTDRDFSVTGISHYFDLYLRYKL